MDMAASFQSYGQLRRDLTTRWLRSQPVFGDNQTAPLGRLLHDAATRGEIAMNGLAVKRIVYCGATVLGLSSALSGVAASAAAPATCGVGSRPSSAPPPPTTSSERPATT